MTQQPGPPPHHPQYPPYQSAPPVRRGNPRLRRWLGVTLLGLIGGFISFVALVIVGYAVGGLSVGGPLAVLLILLMAIVLVCVAMFFAGLIGMAVALIRDPDPL